jgi:antitoxin component YwqK of YwqJK toxin-antitoxin module
MKIIIGIKFNSASNGFILSLLVALFFSFSSYGQSSITTRDTLGLDSLVQVFYQTGKLFYQISYINGVQNGWYEQYHRNGAISHKEYRINGKTVDGTYVYLNSDGTIYQIGNFKNGKQVGKWRTYTSSGQVFKIYCYSRKGEFKFLKVWREKKKRFVRTHLY